MSLIATFGPYQILKKNVRVATPVEISAGAILITYWDPDVSHHSLAEDLTFSRALRLNMLGSILR